MRISERLHIPCTPHLTEPHSDGQSLLVHGLCVSAPLLGLPLLFFSPTPPFSDNSKYYNLLAGLKAILQSDCFACSEAHGLLQVADQRTQPHDTSRTCTSTATIRGLRRRLRNSHWKLVSPNISSRTIVKMCIGWRAIKSPQDVLLSWRHLNHYF